MSWIHHIGLVCSDIQKSEQFYTEHFGLKRARETAVPATETQKIFGINSAAHIIALAAEGGQEIELFEFPDAKHLKPAQGAISHLALFVGNRRECHDRLKAKGIDTIFIDRGEGRYVYFVKDPDGNLIELRE